VHYFFFFFSRAIVVYVCQSVRFLVLFFYVADDIVFGARGVSVGVSIS